MLSGMALDMSNPGATPYGKLKYKKYEGGGLGKELYYGVHPKACYKSSGKKLISFFLLVKCFMYLQLAIEYS